MTTLVTTTAPTTVEPAPSATAESPKPTAREPRRWPRAVVPFLILILIYIWTAAAHVAQTPDLKDAGTLSPEGTGADGSSRLAGMLRAQGIQIQRVTSTDAAMSALLEDDATLFVPAPDLLVANAAVRAALVGGVHRIVLVQPFLSAPEWGFFPVNLRWATRKADPDCATPYADSAGPAGVFHVSYETPPNALRAVDCYDHALVGIRAYVIETIAVGATDPFRNSRIGEDGNAALATALLTSDSRKVVWLDVHKSERKLNIDVDYQQPARSPGDPNPIWGALPPVLWAALVLAALLALLAALVGGRRLGPPVPEPLPVLIPATETVTGRGRLYERIRAREATLQTLRQAAIRRIAPALNPLAGPNDPPPALADLIVRVAARTAIPAETVANVLNGPAPTSDEELSRAAAELDTMVNVVLHGPAHPLTVHRGGTS